MKSQHTIKNTPLFNIFKNMSHTWELPNTVNGDYEIVTFKNGVSVLCFTYDPYIKNQPVPVESDTHYKDLICQTGKNGLFYLAVCVYSK